MMAKIFENTLLVQKLSEDDPECNYVNKMMEMPAEVLRDLLNNTQYPDLLHGVVPTYKLPVGYSYGDPCGSLKDKTSYEKIENRNGLNKLSKNTLNSNSAPTMKECEFKNGKNYNDGKIKQTGRGGLSEDESREMSAKVVNNQSHFTANLQLLLDTLDACSKKMPTMKSMEIFPKFYRPSRSDNIRPELREDLFKESEELVVKQCEENLKKFINMISESTYKTKMAPAFQTFYDLVNSKKYNKRKLVPEQVEEKSVSPPKIQKLPVIEESKKIPTPDCSYSYHSTPNCLDISFNVIPNLSKDLSEKLRNFIKKDSEMPTEVITTVVDSKPKFHSQDSLPFSKSDSIPKKEDKVIKDTCTDIFSTQISEKPIDEVQISADTTQNLIRKPEAAAKQYFVNHSNYSSLGGNTKVAVVAGKVNVTQPSKLNQKPSSQSLFGAGKDLSDSDMVIQGLMAMRRMRSSYKRDFIARMKNLDNDKWLKEVHALKQKAYNCRTQLDYAPQIMVYIRKNLFHNYSLEVKSDFGTSHLAYLENAAMIKQSCNLIAHIYNNHITQINDGSSPRTWNINLVKHFTVIMCHRLSAILQYRAFRNVADDCRRIRDTLVNAGVIERDSDGLGGTSSPLSGLSSYNSPSVIGHVNLITGGNNIDNNRVLLQQYVDHMAIINSSYCDWLLAEKLHTSFCSRSDRHEESWLEFESKIIDKTGGVMMTTIDESVPFVIKFLEGYINFMNEFMRRNL